MYLERGRSIGRWKTELLGKLTLSLLVQRVAESPPFQSGVLISLTVAYSNGHLRTSAAFWTPYNFASSGTPPL